MKTNDLLIELGTEEIPADYILPAIKDFNRLLVTALEDARLCEHAEVTMFATPRRLTLHIKNVYEKQLSKTESVFGPPIKIAKDKNGKWTPAALGFAKKNNIDIKKAQIKKDEKDQEKLYVEISLKEQKIETIIEEILEEVIQKIPFPKQMRWIENNAFKFARPLRWKLCLYGNKNLLGNITYGHRVLSDRKPIDIKSADKNKYQDVLRKNGVVVCANERREIIKDQIKNIPELKKHNINIDKILDLSKHLLDEIIFLTEYPQCVLGTFDEKYLKLPADVLITSMVHHQRYIPVFKDEKDNLLPYFVSVKNTNGDDNVIVKNNERVLIARLEDALFFYNEDTKEKFIDKLDKLKDVVYHKDRSYYEKMSSMIKIGDAVATELELSDEEKKDLTYAIKLSKIDLITNMVYEFPELQGKMAGIYAENNKVQKEICDAVYYQYTHCRYGNTLENLLQITDRLDTLIDHFKYGTKVSGSKDPYGLRRQAYALIYLLDKSSYDFSLNNLIMHANEAHQTLKDFITDRMRNYLIEKKELAYDIVDSVLEVHKDNLNMKYISAKLDALASLRELDDFEQIMLIFGRVINILKQADEKNIDYSSFDKNLLTEKAEKELYNNFNTIKDNLENLIDKHEYKETINIIITLKQNIDLFFDKVMVMVDDVTLRAARLNLLSQIAKIFLNIADFSKITFENRVKKTENR